MYQPLLRKPQGQPQVKIVLKAEGWPCMYVDTGGGIFSSAGRFQVNGYRQIVYLFIEIVIIKQGLVQIYIFLF